MDGRIQFVYATCGRRYFCIRIKKLADTKISGYVWTGPKCFKNRVNDIAGLSEIYHDFQYIVYTFWGYSVSQGHPTRI